MTVRDDIIKELSRVRRKLLYRTALPDNVVAVGNPCRVLREVGERDREFFCKEEKLIGMTWVFRDFSV